MSEKDNKHHAVWVDEAASIPQEAIDHFANSPRDIRIKWDERFLELAKLVASWSKDPSTKVGAVLVRPDKTIASTGFNGYPKAMHDLGLDNREEKYARIIHAEMNALHFCKDQSTEGYTLYVWPMMPCERCAVHVIQAGIKRVVSTDENGGGRWSDSILKALGFLRQCEVGVTLYRQTEALGLSEVRQFEGEHLRGSVPLKNNP